MGAIFYQLNRHEFSEIPLSRWIQIVLLASAGVAAVGWLPGGWITSALLILLFLLFTGVLIYWRKRGYLQFEETPIQEIVPKALPASEKLPIFASGFFGGCIRTGE